MASIRDRVDKNGKKTCQAQVRIKGYPPQTRTFATKTDAKRWAHQTEVDIRSGMHIRNTRAANHTVAELIDEYEYTVLGNTRRGAKPSRATFAFWRMHLGTYALSSVTPKLIEDKRDRLAREVVKNHSRRSPATVLRYMMLLSHAFATAVKWQWCDRNPVETATKPKVNNRRVRYLNEAERTRLLAECQASPNPDLHLVVVLAISTGMRRAEIMGMRWEALTFYEDRALAKLLLAADSTKNGTQRSVLVASHAYQLLLQRRVALTSSGYKGAPAGLLFADSLGSERPVNLRRPWEAALRRANIQDFRFHDLRHTAASYMAMNGATTLEIKEALGHKSTAMAERYSHLSLSHVDDVVLRMNERHFGKSALV